MLRSRMHPDLLWRIRSPLLCPLSYGRHRLTFSATRSIVTQVWRRSWSVVGGSLRSVEEGHEWGAEELACLVRSEGER
jgi:hypothetical protein